MPNLIKSLPSLTGLHTVNV